MDSGTNRVQSFSIILKVNKMTNTMAQFRSHRPKRKYKSKASYKIRYYDEPSYVKEHGGYKYPYVAMGGRAWGVYHSYKSKSEAKRRLKSLSKFSRSRSKSWKSPGASFRIVHTDQGYSIVQSSNDPQWQSKVDPRTKRFLK